MLLACAATLALTSHAWAGSYTATDDASVRADVTTANGDGAASSTITLGNDVTMNSVALPVATKDLTIDSGSFTFLKNYTAPTANQGVLSFGGAATGIVTLKGKITGISGGGNNNGQIGLVLAGGAKVVNNAIVTSGGGSGTGSGGIGVTVTGSTLTNNGTIAAGNSVNGPGGGGAFLSTGATFINNGTLQGGNGTTNGYGISTAVSASTIINNGTIRAGKSTIGTGAVGVQAQFGSTVTNSGTITGGDGTTGGIGVNLLGTSSLNATLNNSGTITGGAGTNGSGGVGVFIRSGTFLTNTGTIVGGDGTTSGGTGVDSGGTTGVQTIVNNGTIRGGSSTSGTGGQGIFARNGTAPIVNTGTIQGGAGAAAIAASTNVSLTVTNSGTIQGGAGAAALSGSVSANQSVTIVNSGTLAAGTSQANLIAFNNATTTLNLELQKGSVITGNVVGNTGVTNTLTLGGDADASFDVSTVGPQYQNFTVFQKIGNSTWTLTGTGSVATPWLISQGTLQIGDATGSIIGDVTDNAALAFNRSDSFTFANLITGSGGVNQVGSGKTILTAANTYTGPTTVTGGTLAVNGSITSAVSVQSGGTLGGNGTVGATTIQSGGNISPGNSIGTLHVNGAFTQNAGSVYQVEVNPTSNASDLILVNGTAAIANGASLNVTKNPAGTYLPNAQYTVLTASGGVTGSYTVTGDTSLSQYLALRESQDTNNVYLRIVQTGNPVDDAQTPNQTNVGNAVNNLPPASSIPTTIINSQSPTDTRSAFDALSGEAQASARGALVAGSLLVRDASFDRLRDLFCASDTREQQNRPGCVTHDGPTPWVRGFGNWGHLNGNANAAGLSQTNAGFLAGVDVPVYDWRLGVFGGYSRTDFDVTGRASSGASNNYHIGAYTGTQVGSTSVSLGASYSWSGITTDRGVVIGTFSNDLRARYDAGTTQIYGEVGQRFDLSDAWDGLMLEPFVNVAHVKLHTAAFSEYGGEAALTSRAGDTENTFATLGVRPMSVISLAGVDTTLRGMLGFRHAFGSVTPSADVSFATGPVFTVQGAPFARNAGVVEAGADFTIAHDIAFGVTYGGQFSSEETDHSVRGTLTFTF